MSVSKYSGIGTIEVANTTDAAGGGRYITLDYGTGTTIGDFHTLTADASYVFINYDV